MAHEGEKRELKEKIERLVVSKYAGNFQRAFDHYDGDKDGKINRAELMSLLSDAGIGNWLTRSQWVNGILAELDTDKDGAISAAELEAGST